MYICIYVYMYICIYIYINIYIHMYIFVYNIMCVCMCVCLHPGITISFLAEWFRHLPAMQEVWVSNPAEGREVFFLLLDFH